MDNDNSRMSTDLFYDDDDMAEMVDAANRSLYDPKKPYMPVLCTTSKTMSQKLGTTLSGLSLGSHDCAETTKLFLKTLQTDLVIAEAVEEGPQPQTIMNMDQQQEGETLTTNEKTMNQNAPSSFISASYFFHEAKERLKHRDSAEDSDDMEMIDERSDENKIPISS